MHDVVVVGGGFGGLSAARILARAGADVVLCETLSYLGGCASTFSRTVDGVPCQFETGATLFGGLGPDGYFTRCLRDDGIDDVGFSLLDPVIEVRTPSLHLNIPANRDAFDAALLALPDAPRGAGAFLRRQRTVANALWPLFDDVSLLPPFTTSMLLAHAKRLGSYLPVATTLGRSLEAVMADHDVNRWRPLRSLLQGMCQITVQTSIDRAEAPFALASIDYPFRGTGHIDGGVSRLADALARGITAAGGEVRRGHRVRRVVPILDGYRLETNHGDLEARHVVLNLLPHDAAALCGLPLQGTTERLATRVREGWSAVMLYLLLDDDPAVLGDDPAVLGDAAHHIEVVDDDDQPFVEGNHIFVSISARNDGHAPAGLRAATVSTHVALQTMRTDDVSGTIAAVNGIQARMADVLDRKAPELRIRASMTASPRTWKRFVGRSEGAVGGPPRVAGLSSYRDVGAQALSPDHPHLWLVGDSVFPGQSILATAVGGERLARVVLKKLEDDDGKLRSKSPRGAS